MNVVKALPVGRENGTAQIATREDIREGRAGCHIQDFKHSAAFASLFDLVEQQLPAGRNALEPNCGAAASPAVRRIDQYLIGTLHTLTHADAGLLLVGKTLSEEVSVANFPQRVIGLNRQEFPNSLTNALASWNVIEVSACVLRLRFDPRACARRVLVLKPPVGIGDWNTVKKLGDRLDCRNRRR